MTVFRPSTIRRDHPWYALVRAWAVLYLAMLKRRIAWLTWRYEYGEDGRWNYPKLDRKIARLEDERDLWLDWLDNPEAPVRLLYGGLSISWFRPWISGVPPLAGARASSTGRRIERGRLMLTPAAHLALALLAGGAANAARAITP